MRSLAHALLALLLCSCGARAQDTQSAAPRELSNTLSRSFGLLIGDELIQQVRVAAPAAYSLDRSALPRSGRANRWFELRDIGIAETLRGDEREYALRLRYQVMTSDDTLGLAALPRPALLFKQGARSLTLRIDEAYASVSPITEVEAWERPGLGDLRPDVGTPLFDTTATKQRLAAYLAALALLGAYWWYRIYGLPWLARSRGPFSRAERALRRAPGGDASGVQAAMRLLHRAFDDTFGQPVFGRELHAFLDRHPRYAPLRAPIERFFDLSQGQFFADRQHPTEALGELRELARRLSLLERGLA